MGTAQEMIGNQNQEKIAAPRIVLIIVYFGPFPLWLPAFLLSCRYNPEIEWLIFSDNEVPPNSPENVRFVKIELAAFNRRASEALGLDIRIQPSFLYKLVDVKPVLGKIFEEYIQGYEFWGHCDLDVLWGNITTFITPDILQHFDIITSRIHKMSGHFCLYRNFPEIQTIFMKIPRVSAMLAQTGEVLRLTEPVFTAHLHSLINPGWFTRVKRMLQGVHPIKPRVYWKKDLTTCGSHQRQIGETPEQSLKWMQGRAFDLNGEEMMYLHFHKLKSSIQEINFGYHDNPAEIRITKSAIMMV